MKFAIIAAGEGSRLAQEGVQTPKPLVCINGEPMIDRLCRIFVENGATEIVVIVNNEMTAVRKHLEGMTLPIPLRLVVQSTPSSMHSLHVLSPYLRGGAFCLTTVDTIFKEKDFRNYIEAFSRSDADGYMAVTSFIDDEKPLYVAADDKEHIIGFHDTKESEADRYISGGIYCLKDKALDVLTDCIQHGMSRMRNFQRQLVAAGLHLTAHPFDKIIDVDHKEDIGKAERFLNEEMAQETGTLIGIGRGSQYSPNLADSDASILKAVARQLQDKGFEVQLCSETEFVTKNIKGKVLFNMARSGEALQRLQQLEQEANAVVINSGFGIANCIRLPMTEKLICNDIPYPKSWIIRNNEPLPEDITYPCWFKRGDGSTQIKEDVSYICNRQEANALLDHFWERGIQTVIVNEHLRGDVIKFYGVQGTDFFYWSYPSAAHSKFGLETINGEAQGLPFSVEQLKQYADKASQTLNVPVYGGDCIVTEQGEMKLIDFNDWPSFAPCREKAAESIALCILNRIKQHK